MADNFGIGTNGKPIGAISNSDDVEVPPSTTPAAKVKSNESITSIVGNNLGVGHGIYAGSNIGTETSIDFRTIVPGIGISIQTDANSLTITNTQSLPDLGSLGGTLLVNHGGTGLSEIPANAILVGGDDEQLGVIPAPTSADTALHWNGTAFEWKAASGEPVDIPEPIDAYTKQEVDALIAGIPTPESIDAYTKSEVDAKFTALPEPKDVYTKAEVDALLAALNTSPTGPSVGLPLIRKPINIEPAPNGTAVSYLQTLIESTYRDVYGVGQKAAHFVLSLNADCSDPVIDEEIGPYDAKPALYDLVDSTRYYWKVRHQDEEGLWSDWSDITTFDTTDTFSTTGGGLKRPRIISPLNMAPNVGISPLLLGSDPEPLFGVETLLSSDWEVYDSADMALAPIHTAYSVTYEPTFYRIPVSMPVWMLADQGGANVVPEQLSISSNGELFTHGKRYSNSWNDDKNWFAKYNKAGEIVWQFHTTDPNMNLVTCLMIDPTGNLYSAGAMLEDNGSYIIVTKMLSETGEVLWNKKLALTIGENSEFIINVQSMVMDDTNNIFLSGDAYDRNSGNTSGFIVKCDPDMNIIWQKTLDQDTNLRGGFVVTDLDGNSYVSAYAYPDQMHLVIMAFDPTGEIMWQTQLRDITQYANLTCKLNHDGVLVIFGVAHYNWIWNPLLVMVRISDGHVMSQNKIEVETRDYHKMAIDLDNNIYLAGSEEGDYYGRVVLTKFNSTADCIWRRTLSLDGSMTASDITVSNDSIFLQCVADTNGARAMIILKIDTDAVNTYTPFGVTVDYVDAPEVTQANYTVQPGIVAVTAGGFVVSDIPMETSVSEYVGFGYGFSLSPDTTYYARVRYTGQTYGTSEWSELIQFTTGEPEVRPI